MIKISTSSEVIIRKSVKPNCQFPMFLVIIIISVRTYVPGILPATDSP